ACADMFQDGFSVGRSVNSGSSFQKVMRLPELQGPLTCAPVQTACAAHWARIQQVFAADAGTNSDGGTTPPAKGGGSCASVNVGALGVLALLALALGRKAR
ncbi:MAG TPA: hypothetical protein VFE90_04280, partial [Myxococcales bacterium]|nr:hypothetical protein [Myxococcales bacterium]